MNEMSITSQVPLTEGHTFKEENGQAMDKVSVVKQ